MTGTLAHQYDSMNHCPLAYFILLTIIGATAIHMEIYLKSTSIEKKKWPKLLEEFINLKYITTKQSQSYQFIIRIQHSN